jgi:hypothetical protein
MKTLALMVALALPAFGQSVENPKWFRLNVKAAALVYDGTGVTITADAGDVVPVSRILDAASLTPEQRAELAPAKAYMVIPLASGFGALLPELPGAWIEADDPQFNAQVTAWNTFDLQNKRKREEALARIAVEDAAAENQPSPSTVRYRERKAARDAKARRDAELAAQWQTATALRSISKQIRDYQWRQPR